MALPRAKLEELSDSEVVERYDRQAKHTHIGLSYWEDELDRRFHQRQTNAMVRFTKWITICTVIVTLATIANVAVALFN